VERGSARPEALDLLDVLDLHDEEHTEAFDAHEMDDGPPAKGQDS